jgi:formate-dependent nitrite reductase membrane component NrfD
MSRRAASGPDRAADPGGGGFRTGRVTSGGGRSGEPRLVPDADVQTYYDRPVLKAPVWKARYIPTYFFTGGLAAGSSLLALGAELTGRRRLARRSRLVAAAAAAGSGGLLVADLGRPERFHHMLRVAKPTSPMSVGSWLLVGYGPAAGVAAATDLLGVLPRLSRSAGMAAAALAPAVASYTGVLVADTAVPAWHDARRELPFLFAAGAAASAGGLGVLLAPAAEAGPARRMALAGAVGEVAAAQVMEGHLGELAAPYRSGPAARLAKAAQALTVTGAAVLAVAGRHQRLGRAGAALVVAGAAVERLAVFGAGMESARDPRFTVAPQRRRLTGKSGPGGVGGTAASAPPATPAAGA